MRIWSRQPTNCGGAPIHQEEMKKSILLLGAGIGIGLAAVSCGNQSEVSYETAPTAGAVGSSGSGVKAKPGASPSAFGPEGNSEH
jgi:F0F1-type ATP synthase membrane subunit c/vacuolar-type H+-ATPase subunit K